MEIILIRHGESEGNLLNSNGEIKMLIGSSESPLTAKGHMQAASLKDNPIFNNVDHFYLSPLKRAQDTASYFCDFTKCSIDDRLNERSLGIFQGTLLEDLKNKKEYKDYFEGSKKDYAHSFVNRAPGGENYVDVISRINSFLLDLKKTNYQKVVIVSHFCVIRSFITIINNLSPEETLKLKVYNCQPIILNI